MLQVELKINGVLIECIDIVNTCHVVENRNAGKDDMDVLYKVYKIGQENDSIEVIHTVKNRAIKLAALALDAITKKENMGNG